MDMRTIIIFFLQHCGVMYVFLNRNQEGLRVWLPSEFLFSFFSLYHLKQILLQIWMLLMF